MLLLYVLDQSKKLIVSFLFSSKRRHTRFSRDWSSDVCSSDLIEPIQSPSGEIVPPDNYLPALRSLCDEHGIWLVVDEVKTGLGRTGRFLAIEHSGVIPDAVILGKGLGGGL